MLVLFAAAFPLQHPHVWGFVEGEKEGRWDDFFLRFVKPQLTVGENQGVDLAYLKSCS